jgi:deazaflavin-dependent oxidoreductase (nitroreductase family)
LGDLERGLYRLLNVGVGLLLRSPLHGLASGRIMLLTVTGRRSGRRFTVPVSYLHHEGYILSFTSGEWSAWWKNLRGRAQVTARVRGRWLPGSARAETNGDAVVRALGAFLTEFPTTAGRYGVGLDADGRPDPRDVEAVVYEGRAVMVVMEAPGSP